MHQHHSWLQRDLLDWRPSWDHLCGGRPWPPSWNQSAFQHVHFQEPCWLPISTAKQRSMTLWFTFAEWKLSVIMNLTTRIFFQKSMSSGGTESHWLFDSGHVDSNTNLAIDPSAVETSKGRFCHASSAKWGRIGAIILVIFSRCAARTVWQLRLVNPSVPLIFHFNEYFNIILISYLIEKFKKSPDIEPIFGNVKIKIWQINDGKSLQYLKKENNDFCH